MKNLEPLILIIILTISFIAMYNTQKKSELKVAEYRKKRDNYSINLAEELINNTKDGECVEVCRAEDLRVINKILDKGHCVEIPPNY